MLRAALAEESLRNPAFSNRPFLIVAAGKASVAMLDACRAGTAVDHAVVAPMSHPLPDEASVRAGEQALQLADEARRANRQLVVLLSGGASAMLAAPADGVPLELKRETTRRLLASGASIHEINAVRKHLSRIKGGRLALGVACITFALSDVTDDEASSIGSGPTVADPSTRDDAMRAIERTGIARALPELVAAIARAPETPKPDDPLLARSRFVLIGGRRTAMDGVVNAALLAAHATIVLDEPITGDASAAGAAFAARAIAAARRIGGRAVVVASGETTVNVRGSGTGGRNQEFALGAAIELDRIQSPVTGQRSSMALAAFGTDGIDGNSTAAGAIADETTVARARAAGLEPRQALRDNDAHAFFGALGDQIVTGSTGTNVGDVFVAMIDA